MGYMDFGAAIRALKEGKKVARFGWNGKRQYLSLGTEFTYVDCNGKQNAEHVTSGRAAIVFHGTIGEQVGWLASQADMLSEDWVIVEAEDTPERDIIRVEAGVRYPEDGDIGGEQDDNDNPKMPFMAHDPDYPGEWRWNLDIDIDTGEVIGWPKEVKARTHYKVCDCCRIKYGGMIYEEYVPDFLSIDQEKGYDDYIILTIEDGRIKNWDADECRKGIKRLFSSSEEE